MKKEIDKKTCVMLSYLLLAMENGNEEQVTQLQNRLKNSLEDRVRACLSLARRFENVEYQLINVIKKTSETLPDKHEAVIDQSFKRIVDFLSFENSNGELNSILYRALKPFNYTISFIEPMHKYLKRMERFCEETFFDDSSDFARIEKHSRSAENNYAMVYSFKRGCYNVAKSYNDALEFLEAKFVESAVFPTLFSDKQLVNNNTNNILQERGKI